MRILVVDDNPIESEVLKKLLKRRFDAEVFQVGTMREADAIIAANNLDCVVLDLQLPDSGIDKTIGHIKDLPYPVYVYTGFDDPTIRERVLNSGAEDFILKATGNASIIERIAHLQFKRKPDKKLLEGAYNARHEEPARIAKSELKNTIPRLIAATVTVLAFVGGMLMSGWTTARDQGTKIESDRLHFVKLDEAILTMQKGNDNRDALIRDLEEKATRSLDERAAIREQSKMSNDHVIEWLKRIETQVTNLYQFQNPQTPPRTTRR